jgi:hypothetical protein
MEGRESLVEVAFDVLDHDNGIIDDKSHSQDDGKQGQ